MLPRVGELWTLTQTQRITVGSNVATFLISGPALVVEIHLNYDGGGDYYKLLWGGKLEEIIDKAPWNHFGEKIS